MRAAKVLRPLPASAGTSGTPTANAIENVSGEVGDVTAGAGVSTAVLVSVGLGTSAFTSGAFTSGLVSAGGGTTATFVSDGGGLSKDTGAPDDEGAGDVAAGVAGAGGFAAGVLVGGGVTAAVLISGLASGVGAALGGAGGTTAAAGDGVAGFGAA